MEQAIRETLLVAFMLGVVTLLWAGVLVVVVHVVQKLRGKARESRPRQRGFVLAGVPGRVAEVTPRERAACYRSYLLGCARKWSKPGRPRRGARSLVHYRGILDEYLKAKREHCAGAANGSMG